MVPMELIYLALAIGLGWLLLRYFRGHGGMRISREALAGLPADGHVGVRGHEVRWTAGDEDSFAAAWPIASGHWVAIRVVFDGDEDAEDEEDADQGHLDLSVAERPIALHVCWTEEIRDRSLRVEVEAVLRALAREAKKARSDATRVALAKPVGGSDESGD